MPPQRIGDIVAGKRAITADTDLRLCRYFGLSDGWWLRGQANYDTARARETMGETLARIPRCGLLAEARGGGLALTTRVVVHPLERIDGGLTQVEERLLQELAIGAGASRAIVWQGAPLSDGEVRARFG